MNLQRISKKVDMHADLSLRVKQFIHNQSINVYYPFDNNTDRNKNVMLSRKAKRSLPDWRRLYPSMTIEKKKL